MSSRHPRLRTLPDGFFRGIASFRALEARIARLPEELCRGDAFEVFVEAYLRTTPVWQVDDLWLVGQVPLDIRKTLNLPKTQKASTALFGPVRVNWFRIKSNFILIARRCVSRRWLLSSD